MFCEKYFLVVVMKNDINPAIPEELPCMSCSLNLLTGPDLWTGLKSTRFYKSLFVHPAGKQTSWPKDSWLWTDSLPEDGISNHCIEPRVAPLVSTNRNPSFFSCNHSFPFQLNIVCLEVSHAETWAAQQIEPLQISCRCQLRISWMQFEIMPLSNWGSCVTG